uniref:Uncharacterized protein n=1 Tax=Lepeophtheirus salmonis TaxID=72036 RepID=A0A0K2SZK5_LEPSM
MSTFFIEHNCCLLIT